MYAIATATATASYLYCIRVSCVYVAACACLPYNAQNRCILRNFLTLCFQICPFCNNAIQINSISSSRECNNKYRADEYVCHSEWKWKRPIITSVSKGFSLSLTRSLHLLMKTNRVCLRCDGFRCDSSNSEHLVLANHNFMVFWVNRIRKNEIREKN